MAVRVQSEPFDVGVEVDALTAERQDAGGVVTFTGFVRGQADGRDLALLTLEHYPGMTELELQRIDDEARSRLRPIVHLRTRAEDGPWQSALPPSAKKVGGEWRFELPEGGPEPLLKALIDGNAGIETLSIERPGLHDAFIAIAGEAAAREMGHVSAEAEAA